MFAAIQTYLMLALSIGAVVLTGWALVDCLRRTDAAYVAAGKLQRRVWIIILAAALGVSIVSVPPPIGSGGGVGGLLSLAAVIAGAVYLADVRPAVRDASPRRRRGGRGGRGGFDDRPPTAWRT
ncbi:DUF2516 family protein [Georgenia sp. Z1491]|uniref:DUF2516 family protein n=1 Tax=Georgenia sp. Z1491 TaxID=3416707 RepID=UPI003CEA1ED3